jgi:MFS family permease
MLAQRQGLRRQPEFLKLWAGQTVSQFGSGITGSALPLTAVLVLGASATQMGLLVAAEAAPFALFGLFAGVWVDRLRRRPLMIWADLGRVLLLLSIPLAFLLGRLQIAQLFLVAALMGVLTVLFDVAYQSFLPGLVPPEQFPAASSRLAASSAAAEVVTPGLAGVLVQVWSAPLTLVLDALSFLCSAGSVTLIQTAERSAPRSVRGGVLRDLREGLHFVGGSPLLRAFAAYTTTSSFFGNWIGALYVLYGLSTLGLGPVLLGLTVGVGGMSNLLGTFLVGPITRRLGVAPSIFTVLAIGSVTTFLIPLAHGPVLLGFGLLALCQAFDAGQPIYAVNALSIRQSLTPPRLLGRVNAAYHVLEGGVGPLGAVVGGILGGSIGVRPTLFLAACGCAASILWLVFSPLRTLRYLPTLIDGEAAPAF